MKVSDIRQYSEDELRHRENELVEQLFAFRLQKVTGQVESPAKVRQTRRDLARVLTVLRERKGA
jgi:large subunit ribosomal protein L29